MNIYFHDNNPAAPGEEQGPRGPTHVSTAVAEYPYQVEQWIKDMEGEPAIVRCECPALGREWRRNKEGKFVDTSYEWELLGPIVSTSEPLNYEI